MKEGQQITLMSGGFLLGAAVGAGLALLFAPASGTDTRRHIGEAARTLGSGTKDKLNELKTGAMDKFADAKTGAMDKFADAKTGAMDKFADVKQTLDHEAHSVSVGVAAGVKEEREGRSRDT